MCHGEDEDFVVEHFKDDHIFESLNQDSANLQPLGSRLQFGKSERIIRDSFEVRS